MVMNHTFVLSIYGSVITPALAFAHPTQVEPATRRSVGVADVGSDSLPTLVFIPVAPIKTFEVRENSVLNLTPLLLRQAVGVCEPTQLLTHVLDKSHTDFVRGTVSVDGFLKTRHKGDIASRTDIARERLHLNLGGRVVVDPHDKIKFALVGLTEERTMLSVFLDGLLWDFEIGIENGFRWDDHGPPSAGTIVCVWYAS